MKAFNDELIEKLEDSRHEIKNLKDMKNGFKQQIILLEKRLGEERQIGHEQELQQIKLERDLAEAHQTVQDTQNQLRDMGTQVSGASSKF